MNDHHETPDPPPPGFDPERDVVLDAQALRGLAHPVRLRLLGLLRRDGPSTATALAARLGLNSGATSYHLRQLATAGLIAEDTERGTARERWWRAVHRRSWYDPRSPRTPEEAEMGATYLRSVAEMYAEGMLAFVDDQATRPEEWRTAGALSDDLLQLTPDETRRLVQDLAAVIARYRPIGSPSAPDDAMPVTVQFQVFPTLGGGERDDRGDRA